MDGGRDDEPLAWAAAQTKVENGTWNERAVRNVTVAAAFERYRLFSKVQHRSYRIHRPVADALGSTSPSVDAVRQGHDKGPQTGIATDYFPRSCAQRAMDTRGTTRPHFAT